MPDPLSNPFATADHRRKALGVFLKNKRLALNYSQAAVASKVGCDPKTISNVETGKSAVTAEILDALVEVLQATRDEIASFAESDVLIGAKEFRVRTHILRRLIAGEH